MFRRCRHANGIARGGLRGACAQCSRAQCSASRRAHRPAACAARGWPADRPNPARSSRAWQAGLPGGFRLGLQDDELAQLIVELLRFAPAGPSCQIVEQGQRAAGQKYLAAGRRHLGKVLPVVGLHGECPLGGSALGARLHWRQDVLGCMVPGHGLGHQCLDERRNRSVGTDHGAVEVQGFVEGDAQGSGKIETHRIALLGGHGSACRGSVAGIEV